MQHHFVNPRRPPAHYLSYRGARKSHHPPAVSILILALSFLALAIAAYYCLRMPAAYTMRVEAKRAELRVIEYVGGIPVAGTCTACPDVVFHTGSKLGRAEDHPEGVGEPVRATLGEGSPAR